MTGLITKENIENRLTQKDLDIAKDRLFDFIIQKIERKDECSLQSFIAQIELYLPNQVKTLVTSDADCIEALLHLLIAYRKSNTIYYQSEELLDAVNIILNKIRNNDSLVKLLSCDISQGNVDVLEKLYDILIIGSGCLNLDDYGYLLSIGLDFCESLIAIVSHNPGVQQLRAALSLLKVGIISSHIERILLAMQMMESATPLIINTDGSPLSFAIHPDYCGFTLSSNYAVFSPIIDFLNITRGTALHPGYDLRSKITYYFLNFARWNTFNHSELLWHSLGSGQFYQTPAKSMRLARELAEVRSEHAAKVKRFSMGQYAAPMGCQFFPSIETLYIRNQNHNTVIVMASKPKQKIAWLRNNCASAICDPWIYSKDGHLILLRSPFEHRDELIDCYPSNRLSGATTDDFSVLKSSQYMSSKDNKPDCILCENPMAGAVALQKKDAAVGIEVISGDVRARKSIFYAHVPDTLILTGSHITVGDKVKTNIHTLPIPEDNVTITVDGRELQLKYGKVLDLITPCELYAYGGGYYFPFVGSISLLAETRIPERNDKVSGKKIATPQNFLSIYTEHSIPDSGQYAALIAPKINKEDLALIVKNFRTRGDININSIGHQAVYGNLFLTTFFRPGEIGGFYASQPCVLAVRRRDKHVIVGVFLLESDSGELELKLPFIMKTTDSIGNVKVNDDTLLIEMKPYETREFEIQVI